jgi:hypothetical protein
MDRAKLGRIMIIQATVGLVIIYLLKILSALLR